MKICKGIEIKSVGGPCVVVVDHSNCDMDVGGKEGLHAGYPISFSFDTVQLSVHTFRRHQKSTTICTNHNCSLLFCGDCHLSSNLIQEFMSLPLRGSSVWRVSLFGHWTLGSNRFYIPFPVQFPGSTMLLVVPSNIIETWNLWMFVQVSLFGLYDRICLNDWLDDELII